MAGEEIPTFKNPDIQMLIQDFTQVRKDLNDERRTSEKKILEERERSAWDLGRARAEFEEKIRTLSFENDGLVRSLGRVQRENDRLKTEISGLKFRLSAPIPEAEVTKEKTKNEAASGFGVFRSVQLQPIIPVDSGSVTPSLGKPVNIRKD